VQAFFIQLIAEGKAHYCVKLNVGMSNQRCAHLKGGKRGGVSSSVER
jgi:hypothetical protein